MSLKLHDSLIDEELIRYGYDEDIWFHVDKYSSAHVYLRLQPGITIDSIPKALLDDCCQLVKANSIEGMQEFLEAILFDLLFVY
jgi:hypothetical protein